MNKLIAFLKDRPGAAEDVNAPRVVMRGICPSHRTVRAIFPKAIERGVIVLGEQDLRNRAFEIQQAQVRVEKQEPGAHVSADAPVASMTHDCGSEQPSFVYELVIRTLERKGYMGTIAKFKTREEANEALDAIEQAMVSRRKKRWAIASIAAVVLVILFMPLPSGNAPSQQRVAQRTDFGAAQSPVLAMPNRLAGPPNTTAPAPFGAPQTAMPMPQGAFPAPVATAPVVPQTPNGIDTSGMPLPTPGIAPVANPYAGNTQGTAPATPAASSQHDVARNYGIGAAQPSDEDPFGLKVSPGSPQR